MEEIEPHDSRTDYGFVIAVHQGLFTSLDRSLNQYWCWTRDDIGRTIIGPNAEDAAQAREAYESFVQELKDK